MARFGRCSAAWGLGLLAVVVVLPAALVVHRGAAHSAALRLCNGDAPHFVIPPLMDLYSGKLVPDFCTYGHFPAYFAGLLAAPLLLPLKLGTGAVDYFYFVLAMRVAQMVMAVAILGVVYRIAALHLPAWFALATAILVASMPELHTWIYLLHPDIYQAATFAAAVYFLILHHQTQQKKWLYWSAVMAGMATATKYYGVFILPAMALSLGSGQILAFRLVPGGLRHVLRYGALYLAVMVGTFLLFNLRLLVLDEASRQAIAEFLHGRGVVGGGPLELWIDKLRNLSSASLFGAAFLGLYVLSVGHLCAADFAHWRRGDFVLHPYQVIHLSVAAFMTYYFFIFSDCWNVYCGERYALSFMCLMPIPVVFTIYTLLCNRRRAILAGLLLVTLTVSQAARVCGTPLDLWQPTPRVIDKMLFDQFLGVASEADRAVFNAAYGSNPSQTKVRLRPELSAQQRRDVQTLWKTRGWLLATPISLWAAIGGQFHREAFATSQTRAWVIAHARKDAVIYAEESMPFYPTTLAHRCYADNRDLPTRNIITSPTIQALAVEQNRPDYILCGSDAVLHSIRTKFPQYVLLDTLVAWNTAYILGRDDLRQYQRVDLPEGQAGALEQVVTIGPQQFMLRGWATDPVAAARPRAIVIACQDRIVGFVPLQRADKPAPAVNGSATSVSWECSVSIPHGGSAPRGCDDLQVYVFLHDQEHLARLPRLPFNARPWSEYRLLPNDGGWLDKVTAETQAVHLEGWAVDRTCAEPPLAVIVVQDGKIIRHAPPSIYRSDVAALLGKSALGFTGWEMHIPWTELSATASRVQLYAVLRDNQHVAPLLNTANTADVQLPPRPGPTSSSR